MEIDKISDKRLNELYARIKPVVLCAEIKYGGKTQIEKHPEGEPYYIQDVDPRGIAFTWDPKPTKRAVGLTELERITTYHTYGYVGFFKPTIAEVLSQIPKGCIDQVVAFNTEYAGISGDNHAAITTLYKKKTIQEINDEIAYLQEQKKTLESKVN